MFIDVAQIHVLVTLWMFRSQVSSQSLGMHLYNICSFNECRNGPMENNLEGINMYMGIINLTMYFVKTAT